jgi:hypothetical protein
MHVVASVDGCMCPSSPDIPKYSICANGTLDQWQPAGQWCEKLVAYREHPGRMDCTCKPRGHTCQSTVDKLAPSALANIFLKVCSRSSKNMIIWKVCIVLKWLCCVWGHALQRLKMLSEVIALLVRRAALEARTGFLKLAPL